MPDETRFLTPNDVASILGVHQKTVHQWLRTGKLEGTKISYRAWRVPQSALDAFVSRNSNKYHVNTPVAETIMDTQSTLVSQENNPDPSTYPHIPIQSKMRLYIRDIMGEESHEH
ncbi:MAG: helix-turn-helix domain-containing protein [Methanoregula sp.]|jgi:excisionase family DNA binding protein